MPANHEKIVEIIFLEIDSVEQRCLGYREELKDTVAEIISVERGHRVARTNIDQQVSDKINLSGRFLSTQRTAGRV